MLINSIILIAAIVAIVKSADWFLGAAEKVGVSLRLPPFILGVILVGFGTSLPELATSMAAVVDGVDTVTIANVAGSNIANILVIIGISTIALGTVKFDKNLIDLDVPLIIGVTALFSILIVDGGLSRGDGILLLLGFIGYVMYSLGYKEDKEHHRGLISLVASLTKSQPRKVEQHKNLIGPFTILILIGSIGILGFASKFAVDAALEIVEELDIAVEVVSFFALAIGTSLSELVVSLKALRKGQGDLVVGNVVGSSMFNILLVAGLASVLKPQVIEMGLVPWTIVGLALAVLLLMAGSISKRIHLWEGMIYMLIYVALGMKIISV